MKPSTPVLMCSVPGYDASGLVRDLAAEENRQITSISIGTEAITKKHLKFSEETVVKASCFSTVHRFGRGFQ